MTRPLAICLGAALACAAGTANAQTIYPLNRAEMLAGARFDFKVEFPGAPSGGAVKVTINGQDPAAVLGKPATFIEKEDGGEYSAFWIRGASIGKPGKYT